MHRTDVRRERPKSIEILNIRILKLFSNKKSPRCAQHTKCISTGSPPQSSRRAQRFIIFVYICVCGEDTNPGDFLFGNDFRREPATSVVTLNRHILGRKGRILNSMGSPES